MKPRRIPPRTTLIAKIIGSRLSALVGVFVFALILSRDAHSVTLLRGDLDNDGKVNVADATRVLQFATNLASPTAEQALAGDVDPSPGDGGRIYGDGRITVGDAVRILRYAVGLIDSALFYAGADAVLNLSRVSLSVNTLPARSTLYTPAAGREAALPLLVLSAEPVSIGGLTVTLIPVSGAPSLRIVRAEPGALLPQGAELITTPKDLSHGVTQARVAVSLTSLPPLSGHGELLRLIVRSEETLPASAFYRITLSHADFTNETADTLEVSAAEGLLSHGG